jgi:hypothetical protein
MIRFKLRPVGLEAARWRLFTLANTGAIKEHGVIAGSRREPVASAGINTTPESIMDQQQYVGLDVSLETTAICVVDDKGAVVWRGKCASTPESICRTCLFPAPVSDVAGGSSHIGNPRGGGSPGNYSVEPGQRW